MDKERELIANQLPLEELMISDIDGIKPPENWSKTVDEEDHENPPVVIEENRGFSLVGNHRTFWHHVIDGRTMVKCLVVRGLVHVRPAHTLINNCTEEALLFEGLLRQEIIPNRSKLAEELGYSRARITQLLNLLKLPEDIRQKILITDEISEFQLRQLLPYVDDEDKLHSGFIALLEKKLSGRQMASYAKSDKPVVFPVTKGAVKEDKHILLDKTEGSLAELENVFSGEEELPVNSKNKTKDSEIEIKEIPPVKRQNMKKILLEIGNLRDESWRIAITEYLLSPLELLFVEGVAKLRTGLYSQAMDTLSEVVTADSNHDLAWFYLGRCSNLTGSLQEAEEYLRNAISRDPVNPDYLVELAIVLEKLKRHSEAEVFYRKSSKIRKQQAAEL